MIYKTNKEYFELDYDILGNLFNNSSVIKSVFKMEIIV